MFVAVNQAQGVDIASTERRSIFFLAVYSTVFLGFTVWAVVRPDGCKKFAAM